MSLVCQMKSCKRWFDMFRGFAFHFGRGPKTGPRQSSGALSGTQYASWISTFLYRLMRCPPDDLADDDVLLRAQQGSFLP
jgi:hypothetical protein